MKIKGKVNGKLYFFKVDIMCKSSDHLQSFLKLNGFRKMIWVDNKVSYINLRGEKTLIAESIGELSYRAIYKLCTIFTKQENNG